MPVCSRGAHGLLAIDEALPFDAGSKRIEFLEFSPNVIHTLIDNGKDAIRGTRSRVKERVVKGIVLVQPELICNPSPRELHANGQFPDFLKLAMGTSGAGTKTLAEAIPSFQIMYEPVAKNFTLTDCKVDKFILAGTVGMPLVLQLQMKGKTEVLGAPGTLAAAAVADIDTDSVYVFHHGTLTIGGIYRFFESFEMLIDNHLEVNFYNTTFASTICEEDREINLQISTPYSASEIDLYDVPAAAATGMAGTLVFNNGTNTLTFTFPSLKAVGQAPSIKRKQEIKLTQQYRAYKSGATPELSATYT